MNTAALAAQSAREEADAWRFMKDRLTTGNSAVSLAWRDLSSHEATVLLDDAATVSVTYTAEPGAAESVAVLPLSTVWRLPASGAEIVEIGAPSPRPIKFYACSAAVLGESIYVTCVRDWRGLGFAALSDVVDDDGRREGQRIVSWAQRSGVREVNRRRERAWAQLYREWGSDLGKIVGDGATTEAIIAYFADPHPALADAGLTWGIWETTGTQESALALSVPVEPTRPPKRLADAIVDAVSTEAWGATREELPRAHQWEMRYEDDPARREDGRIADRRISGPEHVAGVQGLQVLSEFAMWMGARDPVGELASDLADGTVHPARAAALGFDAGDLERRYAADRVAELTTHAGLTRTQAQYVALVEQGFSQREIAERFHRDPSTVSRVLSTAARNIASRERNSATHTSFDQTCSP